MYLLVTFFIIRIRFYIEIYLLVIFFIIRIRFYTEIVNEVET